MPLAQALPNQPQLNDRDQWLQILKRVSDPLLESLAAQQLKVNMPIECVAEQRESRLQCSYLEAFGRLLCGIAPWLELEGLTGPEATLQAHYRELARAGIRHGTDRTSPDYMNFGTTQQSLVDAAFLALAIVRAPNQLWRPLDRPTQLRVAQALRDTHTVFPNRNNWLLFAAMVEACLCFMGEPWDALRVDYAFQEHEHWYLGDGTYGDGPHFHWDYYNSLVIQPFLLNILDTLKPFNQTWEPLRKAIFERAQRQAAIQERLISPEGTFPAIGRSLAYRFGAFHHLAEMSLRRQLPDDIAPEQVRPALTAVMRRMTDAPGTFDPHGWLTIGFAGHQPSIGEPYISTGSLYLCAAAWLPLGLPPTDPFWSAPPKDWTNRKAWGGVNIPTDHASPA